jgi:hypothetical protein
LALRNTLVGASHFAAILLPLVYDPTTLRKLCDTKQHIDDIYSVHGNLVKNSSSYPYMKRLWDEIRDQKNKFGVIVNNIVSDKVWDKSIIHRVSRHDDRASRLSGKRVVLDPQNPEEYSDESRFHRMYSESSHVVDAEPGGPVELHVFITAAVKDLSDAEIHDILADRTGKRSFPENVLAGLHVVNLSRIRQVREWMHGVRADLLRTLTACRLDHRSRRRENEGVTKWDGSRMVTICFHCDQQGYLRAPVNFKDQRMDEEAKFELMEAHDHIADGVILVSLGFCFNRAKPRLPKPCSLGCGDIGKIKECAATLFQQVRSLNEKADEVFRAEGLAPQWILGRRLCSIAAHGPLGHWANCGPPLLRRRSGFPQCLPPYATHLGLRR